MKLNDSQSIYYVVAAIATAAGLAYKIGHVLFSGLKKQLDTLQEDRRKLHVVFREVTPNHGTSIKDKINGMEKSIDRNNEMTEKIFFRQRWLMENQDIPIFETDNEGLCTWVNERYARLFGKSVNYFLGHGWKNIIHPDDRERVETHWSNSVKDHIDSEDVFRVIANDRVMVIKSVANKTEGGYIGSIIQKSCENFNCEDCPNPEVCQQIRPQKPDAGD